MKKKFITIKFTRQGRLVKFTGSSSGVSGQVSAGSNPGHDTFVLKQDI